MTIYAPLVNEILTGVGLSSEQAELYLSLLSHGPQTAAGLAKTTHVQRTYVYRIATELIKLGLASQGKKGRATTFSPLSPDHLLTQAENTKAQATQAQISLESILPGLKTKFSAVEDRPVVSYFEGIEGIKMVYLDTIKEGKPVLALVETSKVEPVIYRWVTTDYVNLRVAAGIPVRAIVASGPKTKLYLGLNRKELRETKVISSRKYPLEHEINLYGTKLAIINHRKGTALLGIIVDSPVVAKTFRSWFELTWRLLS